jgi:hypothetical protein
MIVVRDPAEDPNQLALNRVRQSTLFPAGIIGDEWRASLCDS